MIVVFQYTSHYTCTLINFSSDLACEMYPHISLSMELLEVNRVLINT